MHRWYDPETGRWISEDPIGFAAGDANLYRYVENSPIYATDPSGLAEDWWDSTGWWYLNPWAYNFPIGQRGIINWATGVHASNDHALDVDRHSRRAKQEAMFCDPQSVDTSAYLNSLRLSEAEANRARAYAEAGINYNAAMLGGGALRPTGGGMMSKSSGKLLSGQKYRDFLIKEGLDDGFAARLIGKELTVDWTGQVGTTVFRLGQVQECAGGAGAITKITGFATDNLLEVVRSGKFDCGRVGDVLSRRLGGKWTVSVTDKGQRAIITAIRNGD